MRKPVTIFIVSLLTVALCGCAPAAAEPPQKMVQLIMGPRSSEYSGDLYSGAVAAEQEYGLHMVTGVALYTDGKETQQDVLTSAVESGADAIILDPFAYSGFRMDIEPAMREGVDVIFLGHYQDVQPSRVVAVDEEQMVKQIAEEAVRQKGPEPHLFLLNCADTFDNTYQLRDTLRDGLASYGDIRVEVLDYSKNDPDKLRSSLNIFLEVKEENLILVALDEYSALHAVERVQQLPAEGRPGLFVFAPGSAMVEQLEKDTVTAIVRRNYYEQGYLAVQYAAQENGDEPGEDILVGTQIVNKENMYYPDKQKMLFPPPW